MLKPEDAAIQGKTYDQLGMFQKFRVMQHFSLLPALIVMVFLRGGLGFRRVNETNLFWPVAALIVMSYFVQDKWLLFLGIAVGATGLIQRRIAWNAIKAGTMWHTKSSGYSWLEYLPLPKWFYSEERIYRYLDPIAGYLIGGLLYFVERNLSYTVLLASSFLAMREAFEYQERLDDLLDMYDGQIDAQAMQGAMQRRQSGQSGTIPVSNRESMGVTTGVGDDIRGSIEARQAEMRAKRLRAEAEGSRPGDASPESPPQEAAVLVQKVPLRPQVKTPADGEQAAPEPAEAPDNLL